MIDSHCHIDFNNPETPKLIQRAEAAGITTMLSIACAMEDYETLIQLLNAYPTLYGAFGIHPEYASTLPPDSEFKTMIMAHPHILAVGECGLDYHYMTEDKTAQCIAFEHQIQLAYQLHKPLIIHTREADEDTISILNSAFSGGLLTYGGVLHCFTSTQALADKALEIGFYISASGVITFKNADPIRNVFQQVPLDRLLLETDSPYMAPVPYRGKPNEPSYIIKTAEKLAELKGISVSELDKITSDNFKQLFHIREVMHAS